MLITKTSMYSGIEHTIDIPITKEEYENFINGSIHVQNAFPNLTPDEREFLMTGITREEWNEIFYDDEEDETDMT